LILVSVFLFFLPHLHWHGHRTRLLQTDAAGDAGAVHIDTGHNTGGQLRPREPHVACFDDGSSDKVPGTNE